MLTIRSHSETPQRLLVTIKRAVTIGLDEAVGPSERSHAEIIVVRIGPSVKHKLIYCACNIWVFRDVGFDNKLTKQLLTAFTHSQIVNLFLQQIAIAAHRHGGHADFGAIHLAVGRFFESFRIENGKKFNLIL